MADVKVSALTALTGADLANGDQFLVTDVGSPNVSKSITADQLAQGSQFTSRYKSLTSERIFVPAGLALAVSGSPTMGTLGAASTFFYQSPVLLFDASADEFANIWCGLPAGWTTYDIYMYWSNAGAGSGDIRWYGNWGSFGDGDNSDTTINGDVVIVAAPAQYVIKRTKLNTTAIATNSDGLGRLAILREGSHVTDTLGNDAGIIGFEWVRAS
jgi:hypothetical protein